MKIVRLPLMGNKLLVKAVCQDTPNITCAESDKPSSLWVELGYIPRNFAASLSKELAEGKRFSAEICEINEDPRDPTMNLVVISIVGPVVMAMPT